MSYLIAAETQPSVVADDSDGNLVLDVGMVVSLTLATKRVRPDGDGGHRRSIGFRDVRFYINRGDLVRLIGQLSSSLADADATAAAILASDFRVAGRGDDDDGIKSGGEAKP